MNAPPRSIPFDPRESRVIQGLARWMSLLGRFQIVVAVFLFVVLLALTGLVTTAEVLEPAAQASEADAPLVSIGEVPRGVIAGVVAAVVLFSLAFLRGGMLLSSAAEELESITSAHELEAESLEEAIRRLRSYFVIESLLMVGVAAATYAATIAGWGA